MIDRIARCWRRSYAPDYVGIIIILIGYLLMQFFLEPFHRMFSLDNLAIQYPHAEVERVPVLWLFIYASGVPLAILLLWTVVFRPGGHQVHVTFIGLLISLLLTSFLTDIIKNSVGRPRPDLIDRCKPRKGSPEHHLVTFEICTETNHHVLHDGWRSFPSGHSSFGFSGLGYLSLFLLGQLHVFRPQADLARVLVGFSPLLGAALIAMSRCEDYRHDAYDVTVGSLLGASIAYFSYRRYYPQLRSSCCHVPFPSRASVDAFPVRSTHTQSRRRQNGRSMNEGFALGSDDSDDDGGHRQADSDASGRGPTSEEAVPLQTLRTKRERDLEQGLE